MRIDRNKCPTSVFPPSKAHTLYFKYRTHLDYTGDAFIFKYKGMPVGLRISRFRLLPYCFPQGLFRPGQSLFLLHAQQGLLLLRPT